ncbi:hypothetical protein N7523_006713 [Penicillium sp. IBT 18751x]|nr:hypothetical protein N7523_006713 [Penicillium sp. IBT 18751x]
MKVSAVLSFASLAAALPSSRTTKSSNAPFSVTAARSGSEIHFLPLTASGGHFWLGGKSQTYCPSSVGASCGKQDDTIIYGGNALDVVVPGGQQIYVDASGALSFTVPHSGYIPAGSSTGPFKYTPGASFGTWTYSGQGASGFMACPVPQAPSSSSATPSATATPSSVARRSAQPSKWQVYAALQNATVPSGQVSDCLGFDALATGLNITSDQLAWEYI